MFTAHLKFLWTLIILAGLIVISSCRKDFEYAPSNGNLSFSKDTVYLDTVFTNIGSSTYSLKVYNTTRDPIVIPNILLKNGTESFYRLNVDGVEGKEFKNIPINALDSLFILVETTISINDNLNTELLYTDEILFDSEPFQQKVSLVTLAKQAIFLFSNSNQESIVLKTDAAGNDFIVNGFELDDNQLNFTNEKPYVIYGYATVPEGKQLLIDAGSKIYFHDQSGILVKPGAQIIANGALSQNQELLENEIIFEGDRLEPFYNDIPSQWGGIWLMPGSLENIFNYSTLKNANIGLYVAAKEENSTTSLKISNSQIYNSGIYNLWAENASINAENLVLGGAGSSSLNISKGGNYSFLHSTIANYWNKGFRNSAAVSISNFEFGNTTMLSDDLQKADFKNCIIDGNNGIELSLISNETNLFSFSFQNCLIKYNGNNTSPFYDFQNSQLYSNILLNGFSDFFSPRNNDFRIGLETEALNLGEPSIANLVPFDILENSRIAAPDLGAYQAVLRED